MYGFDGGRRGNYFWGERVSNTEVEMRVKKLRKSNEASKDEVAGKIKNEVELGID